MATGEAAETAAAQLVCERIADTHDLEEALLPQTLRQNRAIL